MLARNYHILYLVLAQDVNVVQSLGFSPRTNVRIDPIRNYFGLICKKTQADTHFFIPDMHNVIMMVWLRNI